MAGLAPDDCLLVELPSDFLGVSVSQLLDRVFPLDEEHRRQIAERFDLRVNPDLTEIYTVFLAVCQEWRDFRCALSVSAQGERVELDTPVSQFLQHAEGPPHLSLHLVQEYRALEYAVRQGFWAGPDASLGWMRSLFALYFLDKHEVSLAAPASGYAGPALRRALEDLDSQGIITPRAPQSEKSPDPEGDETSEGDETNVYAIAPEGRRLIARLLAETESCIDLYDHYQDTLADPKREAVEFNTGRGVDLRVEAFLAEGLEPVRTVFLLRLYDGTLDSRLRDWMEAIETDELFEGILEPVVNRHGVDAETMTLVIEHGYAWLEEQQERDRREASDRDLLRRAGGGSLPP